MAGLRLRPGYLLYLAGSGRRVSELAGRVLRCGDAGEAVFVTRPSVVPVRLHHGRVLHIAVPPSSIAVGPEVPEACGTGRADYVVAEEVWVDGKRLPRAGEVARRGGECLLARSLEGVLGVLGESGRCYVVCGGDVRGLVRSLMSPLVCDLSTLSDVEKVGVEGAISTLWPGHPVLYGLAFSGRVRLTVAETAGTALEYYAKPIAYLDGRALLYEVPYSSSIMFSGYSSELLEAAVRAVLYAC